jgi:hypothetical protein
MKTLSTSSTKIKVTSNEDFTITGEWSGDQSEAMELIQSLNDAKKGAANNAQLYCAQGKSAGDNVFEGTFTINSK